MGVMKAVGEAVREGQTYVWDETSNSMTHSIRCIGIAPWGYVENRTHLVNEEVSSNCMVLLPVKCCKDKGGGSLECLFSAIMQT